MESVTREEFEELVNKRTQELYDELTPETYSTIFDNRSKIRMMVRYNLEEKYQIKLEPGFRL